MTMGPIKSCFRTYFRPALQIPGPALFPALRRCFRRLRPPKKSPRSRGGHILFAQHRLRRGHKNKRACKAAGANCARRLAAGGEDVTRVVRYHFAFRESLRFLFRSERAGPFPRPAPVFSPALPAKKKPPLTRRCFICSTRLCVAGTKISAPAKLQARIARGDSPLAERT